ncbi:MAG: class I SAM-dependent methyltransferase [Bacilli bacterium]
MCEIGIRKGENFKKMIEHSPFLAVAVDSWHADKSICRNDIGYSQKQLDDQYNNFVEEMMKFRFVEIYREYSFDAVKMFDDNFFDFVYIDGDHSFEGCLKDIKDWYPKVKSGGILAGDDYVKWTNRLGVEFGVIKAVNHFSKKNNINFIELPRYGWAIIKK